MARFSPVQDSINVGKMTTTSTRKLRANGLSFTVDEAGEGPDVALCLHGFPECRFSWRHQLPALAEAGWRAVAPDLRGYGETDTPRDRAAYGLDHLVDDVAALFDTCGARRRLLIAHDWGGIIAWTFAMRRRARPLDGLVILNAPHPGRIREVLARSWRQRARSWYVAFFQVPRLPEAILTARRAAVVAAAIRRSAVDKGAFPDDVLEHYRRNALRPGGMKAMVDYHRANRRSFSGPDSPAPVIDTPTLLLWGEQDPTLGVELTEGLEPFVRDLTVERFPGSSHWVQQETPDLVNARLLTWLDRKVPAPVVHTGASSVS